MSTVLVPGRRSYAKNVYIISIRDQRSNISTILLIFYPEKNILQLGTKKAGEKIA